MSSPINKITAPETNRRRFLRDAATGLVVGELATAVSALAQSNSGSQSFAALKQIDAGALNVGYGEVGPTVARRSFFFTAGRTTFTAMLMSRHCWRPQATG